MKQRFCILAMFAILAASFYSCSGTKTYAELLDAQNTSIASFITKRGYTITNEIPTTVPWPDSVFYKTKSGMYIHVIDKGTHVYDTIPVNTPICIRYKEYDMLDSLRLSNMNSTTDPSLIYYNNVSTANTYEDCKAWHEVLDYVGDNGHVYIIAPASVGWATYSNDVLARFYELRYTFAKQ